MSDDPSLSVLLFQGALVVTRADVEPGDVATRLTTAVLADVRADDPNPDVRAGHAALVDALAGYRARVAPVGWLAAVIVPAARFLLPSGVAEAEFQRALVAPWSAGHAAGARTDGEAAARHVLGHLNAWCARHLPEPSSPAVRGAPAALDAPALSPLSGSPGGFAVSRLPAPDDPLWAAQAPA